MVVCSAKSALVVGLLLEGMMLVHRGFGGVVAAGKLEMGTVLLGMKSLGALRCGAACWVVVRVGEPYGEMRAGGGLDKNLEEY